MKFEKGDIFVGKVTIHPIVYLEDKSLEEFYGCMVTHSTTEDYNNNVSFQQEHFIERDENNNPYRLQYHKSYFTALKLIKKNDWGPFTKVGQLSVAGLDFVERNKADLKGISWRMYMQWQKQAKKI